MAEVAKWYVIHTYSGYEKKVETNIAKLIENRGLQEQITDIRVPEEVSVDPETKKESKRKLFPGYVFIKMVMSDDAWHDIKNIRGVTGFVGPESKPVALTEEELQSMKLEVKPVNIDFAEGDTVRIIDGPLNGYLGKVMELKADKSKVKLSVDLFMGRETEVDLEIGQVEVLD
ncbi:MAG: transcription termination/antitermination factor NusG [Clostridia bacterium]|nr:transcription termination/antitermination factor NusG [Clostridia bacterium]